MFNQSLKYKIANGTSTHSCLDIAGKLIGGVDSGDVSFKLNSHGSCVITCTRPKAWNVVADRAVKMRQGGEIKIKFPK